MIARELEKLSKESLIECLELSELQLKHTRDVNARLWLQLNGQDILHVEDGEIGVQSLEDRLNKLTAQHHSLAAEAKEMEKNLVRISNENGELWKRVHHAEAQIAPMTTKRILRAVARRLRLI